MDSYYIDKLAADRLRRCYDLATPRVRQYLKAESDFVLDNVTSEDSLLELGCGYGRVLQVLTSRVRLVYGIDSAPASLQAAKKDLAATANCHLACMDALKLAFKNKTFDTVICIQNGISAFHVDQKALIREALRVTRTGGKVFFSTYSDKFWDARLEWFQLQSEAGLLGEIDWERTGNGDIACLDGFTATTVSGGEFLTLTAGLNADVSLVEVDNSSLFCMMSVR